MKEVRLSGKIVSFSRLTLSTADLKKIRQQLTTLVGEPELQGYGIPVIIESALPVDLTALKALLTENGLQLMAVIDGVLNEQAQKEGVAILPADQNAPRITDTNEKLTVDSQTEISQEVLRTGQQLVNQNGSIVLMADMNSGSEIIATGSVCIRGAARGRVIAGASGDKAAVVQCEKLKMELVSIAGTYCLAEDIPAQYIGASTQVSIGQNDTLIFESWNIPN